MSAHSPALPAVGWPVPTRSVFGLDNYRGLIASIVSVGRTVADTVEYPWPVTVYFPAGYRVSRPGFNPALGWAELLMLIAGTFDKELIAHVAPRAHLDLFTHQAAYGPRVAEQLIQACSTLMVWPNSRRAELLVANDPDQVGTEDLPCTTAIHFLIRDGRLDCNVFMRSWDALWGLTYDIIMFGGLTLVVARCLGVRPGNVSVTASSLHIYNSQLKNLTLGDMGDFLPAKPFALGSLWPTKRDIEQHASFARRQINQGMAGGWGGSVPPSGIRLLERGSLDLLGPVE